PTGMTHALTATTWNDRLRLILVSALQVDRAVFFSTAVTVAAFVPLFTMQAGPLAFLALVGLLTPPLGTEFLPPLEEGNLWIRASLPPTISLEAAMPAVTKMREMLLSHPEVITVVSQHGRPDNGSDAAGFFNAEFFAPLTPAEDWPDGEDKEVLTARLLAQLQEK